LIVSSEGEVSANPEAVKQALFFYMYTNKQASPQLFKSLATDATAQKESAEIANVIGKLIPLKCFMVFPLA
jgi:hypothetical protein